jgi:hypothetical protein
MDEQIIDFTGGGAPSPGTEEPAAAAATEAATRLLARLRDALLASEPDIEPSLVAGNTLEELEGSFAAARELIQKVRNAVRQESAAAVPAGAPGRLTVIPESPFEKIRSGLSRLA